MDDDGLLLNFATPFPSTTIAPVRALKVSGSWKQRLKAKKAFQRTVQNRELNGSNGEAKKEKGDVRLHKKARTEDPENPTHRNSTKTAPDTATPAPPPTTKLIHG